MSDTQDKSVDVELDDKPEVSIEIIDDTPEQDRNRPKRPEGAEPYDVKDEEISQYKESVQERIKRLRYEYHEERRQKEQALRENEQAVNLAKQMFEENRRLQELSKRNEIAAMASAKARAESEMARYQRMAREAYEAGDTEKAVSFQTDAARFAMERDRISAYVPPIMQPPQQMPQQQFMPQQMQRPAAPQPAPRDPKAEAWADQNTWFGKNEEMTGAAYGVHERLVKEGIDPRSDEYYQRLDATMKRRFPEAFEGEEAAAPRRNNPVVAPATRSVKTPRRVQLTASQVALAHKLGLTVEQYAAELVKVNGNG